jgi:hypothetical protein
MRRHAGTPYGISPPKEHPQVTAAVLLVKTTDKPHKSSVPENRMGQSADRAEHHIIN